MRKDKLVYRRLNESKAIFVRPPQGLMGLPYTQTSWGLVFPLSISSRHLCVAAFARLAPNQQQQQGETASIQQLERDT